MKYEKSQIRTQQKGTRYEETCHNTILWIIALAGMCLAAGSAVRLHFKTSGFSIEPLDAPANDAPYQAIMMFLPASDGFAPNVNVQIQPYPGTLDDYIALSQKQFTSAGLKILSLERKGRDRAVMEYSGTMQGHAFHWYALAELRNQKVYLTTATAAQSQWPKVAPKLKSCVDSFQPE
ncbi:MAG: PsbP-related protein [Phycisphaerales bacterium]